MAFSGDKNDDKHVIHLVSICFIQLQLINSDYDDRNIISVSVEVIWMAQYI